MTAAAASKTHPPRPRTAANWAGLFETIEERDTAVTDIEGSLPDGASRSGDSIFSTVVLRTCRASRTPFKEISHTRDSGQGARLFGSGLLYPDRANPSCGRSWEGNG